jgi:N-acetylglutamate synthase-like GNAT family acetyltransferase
MQIVYPIPIMKINNCLYLEKEILQKSKIQFIELEKIKYPLINQFYKQFYKKGLARKDESVFILKHHSIISSVKLKNVNQALLLTGVVTAPDQRGKGYASLLINKLLQHRATTIYCFPYVHLEKFYLQLGFKQLPIEDAPEAISKQFQVYNSKQTLLLMCYQSKR